MRPRAGFTLVELLVVIAIIALLMAILLPSVQRVRRQAEAARCQSSLRQWGTMWSTYDDKMRGFPRDVNCVFMDFSVRKIGLKQLWTLKWHRQFETAGPWTKAGGVQPEDWPEWMKRFKDY
jgi:prepilin-type N-terminal cleavage/methylation domain-containing protein